MRYMSRRWLACAAILGPVASVALAWALSASTDRLFLPLIAGHVGDEPLSVVFLLLPVGATVLVARNVPRTSAGVWLAGLMTALTTVVLAWVVWIGWILVVCGLQDNRCFD